MHPDYKDVGPVTVRAIEECAELIKAISKAQRFGWANTHNGYTNRERVLEEIADVERVVEELKDNLLGM